MQYLNQCDSQCDSFLFSSFDVVTPDLSGDAGPPQAPPLTAARRRALTERVITPARDGGVYLGTAHMAALATLMGRRVVVWELRTGEYVFTGCYEPVVRLQPYREAELERRAAVIHLRFRPHERHYTRLVPVHVDLLYSCMDLSIINNCKTVMLWYVSNPLRVRKL